MGYLYGQYKRINDHVAQRGRGVLWGGTHFYPEVQHVRCSAFVIDIKAFFCRRQAASHTCYRRVFVIQTAGTSLTECKSTYTHLFFKHIRSLRQATGYGVVEFAKCALEDKGDTLKGKRCLITGSGKVTSASHENTIEVHPRSPVASLSCFVSTADISPVSFMVRCVYSYFTTCCPSLIRWQCTSPRNCCSSGPSH